MLRKHVMGTAQSRYGMRSLRLTKVDVHKNSLLLTLCTAFLTEMISDEVSMVLLQTFGPSDA